MRKIGMIKEKKFEEFGIFCALVVLFVAMSFASPVFFTFGNIVNVLRQISQIAIIAVGMAYVIITGGIDLSVGSSFALGGVVWALLWTKGVDIWMAFLAAVAVGGLAGTVSGIVIVRARINPFITTMAMMNVIKGIAYLMTGGMPIPVDTPLNYLGGGTIFKIPVPVIVMIAVLAAGDIALTRTVFGKNIFAVGGNEKYARLSGINVELTKTLVYAITGALSAFAGIISACNLKMADTAAGSGSEMDVIAAVVIGGTSMSGGKGSIKGVLLGAAIMGIIRNGFVLLKLSSYLQMISIGVVILMAVAMDQLRKK